MATLRLIVDPSGAKRGYREAERAGDKYKRSARGVETQTEKVRGSFDRLKTAAFSLKGAFAAIGIAAVVRSFGSGLKASSDFETGLVGVAKTTGLAGQDLETLAGRIDTLSTTIPVPTAELLDMAKAAGQMGITGVDNLTKFSTTVAKLGRASDLAGDEAATALARILNVTGENISEIDILASVFVSLGNNVAATESEIANMTTRIAQSTAAAGLSSAEIAAMGAAMVSMGVRAEAGGTSIGRVFAQMQLVVSQGGQELKDFADILDINAEKFATTFENDKIAGFELLLEGVARQGRDAGAALEEAGLGGVRVAQSLIPLAKNIDEYRRTQGLANAEVENATALNEEFERTLGTLDSQWTTSKNVVASYARSFADESMPTVTTALRAWNSAMRESFAEADNALDKNQRSFLDWSNIINSTLAFSIDVVRSALEIIKTAFEATGRFIGGIAASITQALKFNFSGAATIINELSADFAGLESQLFNFSFARFSDNLNKIQNQMKFKDEIQQAQDLFNTLLSGVPVLNGVAQAANDVGDSARGAGHELSPAFVQAASEVEAALNATETAAGDTAESVDNAARSYGTLIDAMIGARRAGVGIEAGTGRITDEFAGMADKADEAGDTALVTFRSMQQIAEDTASGIRDSWVDAFDKLFRGQIDSFKDFVGSVKDLFIRMIAEISASLVASQIFKFFGGEGGFSLPSFSFGDLFGSGGGDGGGIFESGAMQAAGKAAGQAFSAGFGSTTVAGITGSLKGAGVFGAVEAGTGATAGFGSAGTTAGTAFGGAFATGAAAVALPILGGKLIDSFLGNKFRAKAAKQFEGLSAMVDKFAVGASEDFTFAAGEMLGFLESVAKQAGVTTGRISENITAFKTSSAEQLRALIQTSNAEFQRMQQLGATVFQSLGVDAQQMGGMLQDGVIDTTERAILKMEGLGDSIENPKSGAIELGDIGVEQMDRIMQAVRDGQLRFEALTNDGIKFSQSELEVLGDIGLAVTSDLIDRADGTRRSFGDVGNKVVDVKSELNRMGSSGSKSFGDIAAAANDAGSKIDSSITTGVNNATGAVRSFGSTAVSEFRRAREEAASLEHKLSGGSVDTAAQAAEAAIRALGEAAVQHFGSAEEAANRFETAISGMNTNVESLARKMGIIPLDFSEQLTALKKLQDQYNLTAGETAEIWKKITAGIPTDKLGLNPGDLLDFFGGGGGGGGGMGSGDTFGSPPPPGGGFGMAEGGIVSGPKSGFLATLHGREAVIPLKNGNVPVEIQGKNGDMHVTINQNITGADADEVERQTRRALNRVALEWAA